MKIKISKNIRKYLIIYLGLLVLLYLVIIFVPKITDIFETKQILEPGTLVLSCETTGYLIKTEAISVAEGSGEATYSVKEGTIVGKGRTIAKVKETADAAGTQPRYTDLMEKLGDYNQIYKGGKAPISGVVSFTMDGCESVLNPGHLDSITKDQVKSLSLKQKNIRQDTVAEGDPMFKTTNDSKWYVICWLGKGDAEIFSEGQEVKLQLPAGTARAVVRSISKDEKKFKVVFYSDMYYKELATTRKADMTIVNSDRTGLLIDNECIIEKDGKPGVFVRDKNGNYYFVRINVIETDGTQSVISESSFIDAEGGTVYTVSVYDEVLKNPKGEMKKLLKKEEKEAKKKEKN